MFLDISEILDTSVRYLRKAKIEEENLKNVDMVDVLHIYIYAPYCKAIKYFVEDTTVKELNGCMSCHFGTSIDTPSWVACFSQ